MTHPRGVRRLAARLAAAKRGEWSLPLPRLASRLREIFGEIHVDYVDLGEVHTFPLTLEVFTLIDRDLTLILYRGLARRTALALGNVTEANAAVAADILARLQAHPLGPAA